MTLPREKIVVFGAGATGRGHVGLLAWQAGFEIVWVDKKADLVQTLRRAGRYAVTLHGRAPQQIEVTGFRVFHSEQREAIADEIRTARLVLTAVFDQNLPDVAETLALGVAACASAGRGEPLDCIACENMMDSSSTLGRHVRRRLAPEAAAWCAAHAGFPDCMISRVVPRPEPDPLRIVAEDYNEWTARAEAFAGPKPAALRCLEAVDNQTARLERKLFLHNGGHAVCGYFGFHRGHTYIHEAVADPAVAQRVLGAMHQIGEVVQRKHGFSRESIEAYIQDFGRRGAIPEMRDSVLRVVRDPIRKLSPRERLVAPAVLAVQYGLPRDSIVAGIVAAMKYAHPEDPQSVALAERIARDGPRRVVDEICGVSPGSPLFEEIADAWSRWLG